jgi:N-acyl-D-amino-acid deacylase
MQLFRRTASSLFLITLFAFSTDLALVISAQTNAQSSDTILIFNAQLADGTGAPLREGALRIRGNRIVSIGQLSAAPDERVLDAHGLVLAPGFIDIHNHSLEGLESDPLAETQIAQGITTAVQGPRRRISLAHSRLDRRPPQKPRRTQRRCLRRPCDHA